MRARTDSVLRLLVAVALVEVVFAAVTRTDAVVHMIDGRYDAMTIISVAGLPVLLLLAMVIARVASRMRFLHQEIETLTLTGSDWYWEADADLVLTYCSASVADLLGYQPEEMVGRSTFEFIADEDAAALRDALRDAQRGARGWDTPALRWRRADGLLIELTGSAIPAHDGDGSLLGFRGSRRTTDLDRRKRFSDVTRERILETVRERALEMALQPIVDLASGRLVGVEALARFPDGRPPDAWFSDARRTGCERELELVAAKKALALLPVLGPDVYVSVNASPALIEHPHFEEALVGVDVSRVVVEITEHAAVGQYDTLNLALSRQRNRGLRVAVDDTGAGYASFNHVLQLRPDIIKIDRAVVARTTTDAAARALVTAVLRLAQELDASVVGEGIETAFEYHTLRVLGLACGQGFFLERPTTETARWERWPRERWRVDRRAAVSRLVS